MNYRVVLRRFFLDPASAHPSALTKPEAWGIEERDPVIKQVN